MRYFASTIALAALIFSASTQARGESPLDCLTQEGCFCALNQDGVYVVRNGYEKGFLSNMGTGPGWVSCSKSTVIATRQGDNNVYVTDLASGGAQCAIDVGEECRQGVVSDMFPPYSDIVYIICPTNGFLVGFEKNCTAPGFGHSGGVGYEMIAETPDSIIAGFDNTQFAVFAGPGGAIQYPSNLANPKGLVYSATLGALLINEGSNLYQVQAPWSAFPTLMMALPGSTEFMSVSDSYVALSSTGSDVYVVSTATQTVTQTINVGTPGQNAVSENALYVINGAEIDVYDPATGAFLFSYTAASFGTLAGVSYLAPTQQGFCGNSVVETQDGESCDGTELDHQTCQTGGYDSGTLTCDGSCNLSLAGCTSICGNGHATPAETCDGVDTKGRTCVDEGFAEGTLLCNGTCDGFDTSGCTNCGNGVVDAGEVCDGANLGGNICQTVNPSYTGGQLACNGTCDDYDTSACTSCGNGTAEAPFEECDGADFGGSTCASLGLSSGTLACYENCTLNTQGCAIVEPQCGDGNVDAPTEECDDGNRINGDGCDENCYLESADCGNGVVDAGEECDPGDGESIPEDLNGETCESRSYLGGGTLLCTTSCRFDETYCQVGFEPDNSSLIPNEDPSAGDLGTEQAADLYELNTETLAEQCVAQLDGEDLIISSPEESYCNYGAESLNKTKAGGVWIHMFPTQEGELPLIRIKQTGEIIIEAGATLVHNRGMRILHGDSLVSETMKEDFIRATEILSVWKGNEGRWLVGKGLNGFGNFCLAGSEDNPDKCIIAYSDGTQFVIPLHALGDFNWKLETKSSGGCSTAGDSKPVTPIFVLLALLGLGIRRRRRTRS